MDDLWTEFEVEITEMLNESVKQAFIEGSMYSIDPDDHSEEDYKWFQEKSVSDYEEWVASEQS